MRNKARLVAKWYNQGEGIGFDEIFAHMTRLDVICMLVTFASHMGIKLFHMDIKCAFLNDFLNEEVYVEQPLRFENL